jgi:hypothetical protein
MPDKICFAGFWGSVVSVVGGKSRPNSELGHTFAEFVQRTLLNLPDACRTDPKFASALPVGHQRRVFIALLHACVRYFWTEFIFKFTARTPPLRGGVWATSP